MGEAEDDRFDALGQMVEKAAVMEIALRIAFCALLGDTYAAVVASAQEAHWLIDNCETLARQHQAFPAAQQDALRLALRACREASHDRNRLVHDAWDPAPGRAPITIRGTLDSYEFTGRPWTLAEIQAVTAAIDGAQRDLMAALERALQPVRLHEAARRLAAHARERQPNSR
jgi:hypothetical protein